MTSEAVRLTCHGLMAEALRERKKEEGTVDENKKERGMNGAYMSTDGRRSTILS